MLWDGHFSSDFIQLTLQIGCDLIEWLYWQCQRRKSSGFDPSILRHSGIWRAADEAVWITYIKRKKSKNPPQQKTSIRCIGPPRFELGRAVLQKPMRFYLSHAHSNLLYFDQIMDFLTIMTPKLNVVFTGVYRVNRLEIQSVMLVFATQLCELLSI
jgi:hypothetical protein